MLDEYSPLIYPTMKTYIVSIFSEFSSILSTELKGFPFVVCERELIEITEADNYQTNRSIFPLKKFRTRFHQ